MRKILAASLFMMLALGIVRPVGRAQPSGAAQETKEIQMTAKKYEYSPSVVEVTAGTRIVFRITALDREHGFQIAGAKTGCVKIRKGETATVEYSGGHAWDLGVQVLRVLRPGARQDEGKNRRALTGVPVEADSRVRRCDEPRRAGDGRQLLGADPPRFPKPIRDSRGPAAERPS